MILYLNGMTAVTKIDSVKAGITQLYSRTKSFSNTFFPFCIKGQSKLDVKIRNLLSVSRFKKSLLIYFKIDENSIFDVHSSIGIKAFKQAETLSF